MKKTIMILLCVLLISCAPKESKDNKLDSNMLLESSTKESKNQNENIEKTDLGQSDDSSFYYNHIKNARYTTADFKSKEFNKDWLGIESDTSSIDLNSLLEDVSFIASYLNELELE